MTTTTTTSTMPSNPPDVLISPNIGDHLPIDRPQEYRLPANSQDRVSIARLSNPLHDDIEIDKES